MVPTEAIAEPSTLRQMQLAQDEVRAERAAQQAKKAKKDAAKNSKKGKGDHS